MPPTQRYRSIMDGITPPEYSNSAIRRLFTIFFHNRAIRHLETLATAYNWTPEELEQYKLRFIRNTDCIPEWAPEH